MAIVLAYGEGGGVLLKSWNLPHDDCIDVNNWSMVRSYGPQRGLPYRGFDRGALYGLLSGILGAQTLMESQIASESFVLGTLNPRVVFVWYCSLTVGECLSYTHNIEPLILPHIQHC